MPRLLQNGRSRGLLLLACVGLSFAGGLAISRGTGDPDTVSHASSALRALGAALFLGAGILRVSRWRVGGDSRSALMGVALIVFGGLSFPLARAASVFHVDVAAARLSPFTQLVTTAITFGLVVAALRAPRDGPLPRIGRLIAQAVGAPTAAATALVSVHVAFGFGLDPGPRLHLSLELGLAAGWFVLAALANRTGSREAAGWAVSVAPLLATMGAVGLLRAAAVVQPDVALSAAALAAVVATVTLVSATSDFGEVTNQARRELLSLQSALQQAELVLDRNDRWRRELTHDSQNAMTALRTSMTVLSGCSHRLDEATAARLRAAVLSEIAHVEHLISRSGTEQPVDFDVHTLIAPIIDAHRTSGLEVQLVGESCRARGRPGDLATILENLLVNAHRHGRGAAALVRTRKCGPHIEIAVEDQGPGIAPEARESVFEPGVRCATSTGSGLGLHVARTLARSQGGDLLVHDRPGGGTVVVLTLPAGSAEIDPDPVAAEAPLPPRMHAPRQRQATG